MFDLNRRKLLIGSLISGAAIAAPALAFAEDRYQVLVQLQRDAIQSIGRHNSMLAEQVAARGSYNMEHRRVCSEASGFTQNANKLLDFMLREFNRSDLTSKEVHEKVRGLFNKTVSIDTMNADELRSVEDAVVCIAVMKNLLTTHRAPFDSQRMPLFNTFAGTYKNVIL